MSFSQGNERTQKAIMETIRICKDKDVLTKYLENKEKEVITMMMLLYDDEWIMKNHDASLKREITEQMTEQGVKILVKNLQRLGGTFPDAVDEVQTGYDLSKKAATALVKKFWNTEHTLKH